MAKPLAPLIPVDYILEDERELEDPTVFSLRCMSGAEYLRSINYASAAMVNPENLTVSMECALKFGLVDWKNFGDAVFSQNLHENIERLKKEQFVELAGEVLRMSRASFEDKKK